jgi:hypothetical protein
MVFNGGQSAGYPSEEGGIHEKVIEKTYKEDLEKSVGKAIEKTFGESIEEAFKKAT